MVDLDILMQPWVYMLLTNSSGTGRFMHVHSDCQVAVQNWCGRRARILVRQVHLADTNLKLNYISWAFVILTSDAKPCTVGVLDFEMVRPCFSFTGVQSSCTTIVAEA